MIEVSHLDKYYAKGSQREVHAVRDTTLQLPDTGMVALFGASGCGKTTLLNIIGGLDRADRGSVILDGARVLPNATETRNCSIGYIFQNYHLLGGETVFENVALSLRLCGVTDVHEIETRTMAALDAVDMAMYRRRLPGTLSGGQQQRVAIARALVKNPRLILADEPTGNLDEQNTVMVMELLRQVAKNHLVLLVTHEHDLLPYYCERIIEISDGAVVSVRDNEIGDGYRSKGKSDVYLGDLPYNAGEVGTTFVEIFGGADAVPSSLRLISHGGTLYIAAPENVRLRVLDASSEVRVHECSYHPEEQRSVKELPPVLLEAPKSRHKKCGRMFGFWGALISGFRSHFGRVKRGKKTLIAGLIAFAISFVVMISYFGTSVRTLQEARLRYNTDMVYVPVGDLGADQLRRMRSEGLIDSVTFGAFRDFGDGEVSPSLGNYRPTLQLDTDVFEVAAPNMETGENAEMLDLSALSARKKVTTSPLGKFEGLSESETVISTGLADALIESSGMSYLKTYSDLLYHRIFRANSYYYDDYADYNESAFYPGRNTGMTIVGIVEDKNPCLYVSPVALTGIYVKAIGERVLYAPESVWATLGIAPPPSGTLYAADYDEDHPKATCSIAGKTYRVDGATIAALRGGTLSPEQREVLDSLTFDYYYMSCEDYLSLMDDAAAALPSSANPDFTHFALHAPDTEALCRSLRDSGIGNGIYTPEDMYSLARGESLGGLIATGITAIVFLVLMVLCLFLIMRSGLMASVRQIGVLRAIGVSRGNLLFRFFTESLVVFALTVLPGYLFATISLAWLSDKASVLVSAVLYYPAWIAALTFAFLLAVTAVCGTLPVLSLTRKTPAAIIAKYDI